MITSIILISCMTGLTPSLTPEQAKLSIKPPAKVAVLPVPNLSKDKWEELKTQESAAARARLEELLTERGFEVVPDAEVDRLVADAKLDFKDEEQWSKKNILSIGSKAKAGIVAFIAIKQTRVKTIGNIFLKKGAGEAQIESWLLEVSGSKPILDGVAKKGEKQAPPTGATGMRIGAVRRAVEATFEPVLKEFPKNGRAGI